jgi:hypothetical protein
MRDGQFTTTYRRDVMCLWCNRCEKSIVVEVGRVDDELLDRHLCGPPGTAWDSGQMAADSTGVENYAGVE